LREASHACSRTSKQGVTVNKTEFVSKVAKSPGMEGLSAGDTAKAVQAVLDEIKDALSKGDDVAFAGFGKFTVSHRAARVGVNPQDPSKKVEIPARTVPRFTPGAVLKEAVARVGR
jgi:DNA-binding protein HU-beta